MMNNMNTTEQKQKRPRFITILIIVFILLLIRQLSDLLRCSTVTDYVVLSHFGIGSLYIVYSILFLLVAGIALVLIFRKHPRAFHFSMASLVLYFFASISISVVSLFQLDIATMAYISSREARGLTVSQEPLDLILSPAGIIIGIAVIIIIAILLIKGLIKNKRYLENADNINGS